MSFNIRSNGIIQEFTFPKTMSSLTLCLREHSGSVVEYLTRDQGAAASSLTGVTALWSLSKTHLS